LSRRRAVGFTGVGAGGRIRIPEREDNGVSLEFNRRSETLSALCRPVRAAAEGGRGMPRERIVGARLFESASNGIR